MALHVKVEEFDVEAFGDVARYELFLEFDVPEKGFGIPILLLNGRKPGKTLLAIAGIHGDELAGVQAVHEVARQLDPGEMSGRFLGVPIANLSAYWSGTRRTPVDNLDLARTFPGRKVGSVTESIAFYISEKLIARSDFLVDLHTGGWRYRFPLLVGYDGSGSAQSRISRMAALSLGFPVVWGHYRVPPGRTIWEAARRSIPWLYTEASGDDRASPHYSQGLLNLLKHLGIVPGPIELRSPELDLEGDGDIDLALAAQTSGYFVSKVDLLQLIRPGEVIGIVRGMHGEILEEIRSPEEGYVIMLRSLSVVHPGDSVALIAKLKTSI